MSLVISSAANFFTLPFRKCKYEVNPPYDVYNVMYLGNVLTTIGKGNACVDKPLDMIWRTYNNRKFRRDISMKLSVTKYGLKAVTKQGLTEYWAHRLTYCTAPEQYPRVFCWVYKHEGRCLKPELRCHAILCRNNRDPSLIFSRLSEVLQEALMEYKREKLTIEKLRKNSLNGQMGPRRKILLQTGSLNFRTPINRSRSAPRLGSIDEEDEASVESIGISGPSSFHEESEDSFLNMISFSYQKVSLNQIKENDTNEEIDKFNFQSRISFNNSPIIDISTNSLSLHSSNILIKE